MNPSTDVATTVSRQGLRHNLTIYLVDGGGCDKLCSYVPVVGIFDQHVLMVPCTRFERARDKNGGSG